MDNKQNKELPVITDKPTTNEEILLTRIKQLEEKLAKVQTENEKLNLESKQLKSLVKSEKERADNCQQQLKTISKLVYQWQKINYYQRLDWERKVSNSKELEVKIEQPFKPPPRFKK